MKSAEDTTIAEFSSGDNRCVEMEGQEHPPRAYLLRWWWEGEAELTGGEEALSYEEGGSNARSGD